MKRNDDICTWAVLPRRANEMFYCANVPRAIWTRTSYAAAIAGSTAAWKVGMLIALANDNWNENSQIDFCLLFFPHQRFRDSMRMLVQCDINKVNFANVSSMRLYSESTIIICIYPDPLPSLPLSPHIDRITDNNIQQEANWNGKEKNCIFWCQRQSANDIDL